MTTLTARIETFLKQNKCVLAEIGLLQPADPILNASGEDIRRRIFITADQHGKDLCLRPEFTIPVCLEHLKTGKAKTRYGYVGKVFRHRADEPTEFVQAGIEDIGARNPFKADARSLSDALGLLRLLGKSRLTVSIGDQAVFEAVLKSLGLPGAWRQRLVRAFGDKARLMADLDRLEGKGERANGELPPKLQKALDAADRDAVTHYIAGEMKKAGLSSQTGRSAEEIAARMMEKAELATTRLTHENREILEMFLGLDLPLAKANAQLWSFSRKTGIPLGEALEDFHRRTLAIQSLGLENVQIRYQAAFGRRLDYYTGFVFEVRGGGQMVKPLAGGGRYDRLLTVLGSGETVPAIGFAVYVDRVLPTAKAGGLKAKGAAA